MIAQGLAESHCLAGEAAVEQADRQVHPFGVVRGHPVTVGVAYSGGAFDANADNRVKALGNVMVHVGEFGGVFFLFRAVIN